MRVLVLNGSPRRGGSHSMLITGAFLRGFPADTQVRELTVSDLNIQPCKGCFSCWYRTPGRCVMDDDMQLVRQAIAESDVILGSFPLYFLGLPSGAKALLDRCLPYELPYRGTENDLSDGLLSLREDALRQKRVALISTCEYVHTETVYKPLREQFNLILGAGKYTTLFVSEGTLFGDAELKRQRDAYLELVTAAGREFAADGRISPQTSDALKRPLVSQRVLGTLTDAYWNRLLDENNHEESE